MAFRFVRVLTRRGFNTSAVRANLKEELLAEEKHAEGLFWGVSLRFGVFVLV